MRIGSGEKKCSKLGRRRDRYWAIEEWLGSNFKGHCSVPISAGLIKPRSLASHLPGLGKLI
jgi:hypothetical protein